MRLLTDRNAPHTMRRRLNGVETVERPRPRQQFDALFPTTTGREAGSFCIRSSADPHRRGARRVRHSLECFQQELPASWSIYSASAATLCDTRTKVRLLVAPAKLLRGNGFAVMATVTVPCPQSLVPSKLLPWHQVAYAIVIVSPRRGWLPTSPDDVPLRDDREPEAIADAAQAIARQFNTRAMIQRGSPDQWAVVVPIELDAVENPAAVLTVDESEGGDV